MEVKGTHEDIFLKTLSTRLFQRFSGKFTKVNTIVIDDSPTKHILNDLENVLLSVSWSHDGAGPSNMFLIDMLLPKLHELHRSQDIRVARRIRDKIGQPMLFDDPFSVEYYIEIKQALDNAP